MQQLQNFLWISIFALATSLLSAQKFPDLSTTNDLARLKKDLFANNRIDIHVPPADEHTNAINMTLAMETIHIQSLDEVRGILTLNCWLSMTWKDKHFEWNPSDYGGVKEMRLPRDLLWTPDVTLYNSAHLKDFKPVGEANVIVINSGQITWIPPATFQSTCPVNHKKFPFDEQACILKFGSWTFGSNLLNLQPTDKHNVSTAIETIDYIKNEEWKLVQVTSKHDDIKYPCCEETYQSITYRLHLKRRHSYYTTLLVMPTLGSIILTLSGFLLPPTAPGRVILPTFSSILQLALLIFLGWKIPPGSDTAPNIMSFIGFAFSLSTTAMILTIFTAHLARRPNHEQNPRFLRDMPKGLLGKIFCLGGSTVANTPKDGAQLVDNSQIEMDVPGQVPASIEKTADWGQTATVIDRVHNVAFLLTYCISAAVCFL